MKNLVLLLLFFAFGVTVLAAQDNTTKLSWALPEHPGTLTLPDGKWEITENSAKANGNEFGIRARNRDLSLLGFLFVWPEKAHLTAESCREDMLASEDKAALVASNDRISMKSANGTDIALALLIPNDGRFSSIRAFVASGDLCGDLLFKLSVPVTTKGLPMEDIKDILKQLQFNPSAKPSFRSTLAYATVEFDHRQYAGAALAYRAALMRVGESDDPTTWRRVTTDQLTMALGISGDLQQSRAVNVDAIAKDPAYPLYYYDLACADAEAGDAVAARTHLQQAYDRRMHVLPGEVFPDPSKDDSLLKLKRDPQFWSLVTKLSASEHSDPKADSPQGKPR